MGDALRRVVRVDGDVGGAGLDDGDKSGDQVGAAGYVDRDELLRAHPAGRQVTAQLVRPCVEFRVRHVLARAGQCHRIRRRGGLLLEQCHHIHGRGLDLLPVPLLQELMPLRRVQQLGPCKGLLRISGEGGEEVREALEESRCGTPVEQIGAELHGEGETVRLAVVGGGFVDGEGQVELGDADTGVLERRAEPGNGGQCPRGVVLGVVEGEHDLEEGVVGEGAGGVEVFNEAFEGEVLVGVGVQVGFADPVQQFAEGGLATGVGAQDEGVDEEADQIIGCLVGTPGDGGADRDVGSCAEAGEEGGQGGMEDHEQAGAVLLRQRAEIPVECSGQVEGQLIAGVAGGGGPWVIRG